MIIHQSRPLQQQQYVGLREASNTDLGIIWKHMTDVDESASLEYLGGSTIDNTTSLARNYGTLELDTSTGAVHTPESNSIEALNAGQSASDEFKISVSDSMALTAQSFRF